MKHNKTLLVGPWVGEFGWELFTWQGYARRIAENYDKVIVISKPGHKFLYEDFCDEYISFSLPPGINSDSWFCRNLRMEVVNSYQIVNKVIEGIRYEYRLDPNRICNGMFLLRGNGVAQVGANFLNQKFVRYKSDTIDYPLDLILHPRNKGVGDTRNWDKEKWQNLVDLLKNDFSMGIIGSDEAFLLNDVIDLRNIPIENTVSVLNRTNLIVGQSSGPLHLASLCGTPQLVWSTEHNRIRYMKYWNPFKTPVYFHSEMGWNPTVDFIYQKIKEVM